MILLIYVAIAVLVTVGIYRQIRAHIALRQSVRALVTSYDRLFRHIDTALSRLEAKSPEEQRGWPQLTVEMHKEYLITPETAALAMLSERLIVIRDTLAMKNLERAITHRNHTPYYLDKWEEKDDDPFLKEVSPLTSSPVKRTVPRKISKAYAA